MKPTKNKFGILTFGSVLLLSVSLCNLLYAQDDIAGMQFGGKPLPASITDLMDKLYPGWQPMDNLYLLESPITNLDTTVAFPNHVWADFNNDEKLDHVLFGERMTDKGRQEFIIAFVSTANSFDAHELCIETEPAYCGNMIWKLDKGDKLYSWEKGEHVEAPSDGVHSIVLEKGRVSYIYMNGQFKMMMTGD